MFNFKKLIKSFGHASNGIRCVSREQNFQIESFVGFFAIALSVVFDISRWESAVLILMIILVLVLEIINTIFERITDILRPRLHPYAKAIKDMMAGAVLLACLGSLAIGIIIFVPYIGIG